mmetsp:Transcript_13152/g.26733  ORF Transcript_13152/g.26733 Transcript_13152/m.26733 type:complete len:360 (-) Transcript_13152:2224-3303(-)
MNAMMPSDKSMPLLLLVAAVSLTGVVDAFSFPLSPRSVPSSTQLFSSNNPTSRGKNGKAKFGQRTATEASRFLADFRTANGEIIDPYRALRLPRSATLDDIKTRYRKLSRKLHPDAVSKSRILPGQCQNLDEVREEWEKVKFSYEILSDPKARKSYDRNSSVAEVLEDPGAAVGRAVVGGAFTAVGAGFGAMWKVGELAVKGVASVAQPPPPPPVRKDTTNNAHTKKTQTKAIEREAPTVTENNVDTTTQARVWTLEEMRVAASTAAAAAGDSPKVQTETIPITFDSNKADTPIIRNEEPSLPDSEKIKANSSRSDEVDDKVIKMITPEPLTVSSTAKSKAKKPRRAKANVVGNGFSKK